MGREVAYINVVQIGKSWLFEKWTTALYRDLSHYHDKELRDFCAEFIRIELEDVVIFVRGLETRYRSQNFAEWYFSQKEKPTILRTIRLDE